MRVTNEEKEKQLKWNLISPGKGRKITWIRRRECR